ncbi:class I SAM-dependent methyltransferase [Marinobacter sp. M216]|uniref:Ribosomal RNA small subunit methyltransferase J n=1 Tax=Marinobacter albus TaxID=3030833 RepID=A0ABT7HFX2_9GAMM|nr:MULTISPECIES: class I SAM-dependent methyltransferase [unclassified Marinobacter]MBW7472730.1 class I SAM-dependent methyltransferase [Marinobacter sp. F4218]MDK9559283.1 class I SAM-dependent methyltransferase [Marinobacter sp. M216]
MPSALAVGRSPLGDAEQAVALSQSLAIENLGIVRPKEIRDFAMVLYLDENGLGLQVTGKGAPGPVRAEFVTGKMGYRREHGGGAGQMVAKAVGLQKTRATLRVVDATAGLGQDAFVLASLGCEVTLFERNPVIHALLADGLARASLNVDCAPIIARMSLKEGSSLTWLEAAAPGSADVIYLDPMFPHRDKSALVKKEMQVFRSVVGDDTDAEALLEAALGCATYRVVVKRPRKAPTIAGPEPATRIEGKSSRYDIYSLKALPAR